MPINFEIIFLNWQFRNPSIRTLSRLVQPSIQFWRRLKISKLTRLWYPSCCSGLATSLSLPLNSRRSIQNKAPSPLSFSASRRSEIQFSAPRFALRFWQERGCYNVFLRLLTALLRATDWLTRVSFGRRIEASMERVFQCVLLEWLVIVLFLEGAQVFLFTFLQRVSIFFFGSWIIDVDWWNWWKWIERFACVSFEIFENKVIIQWLC